MDAANLLISSATATMEEHGARPSFSLLGGPLHKIGCRLGLVRGTNTVRIGLVLGLGLWIVLVALAFISGVSQLLFSLSVMLISLAVAALAPVLLPLLLKYPIAELTPIFFTRLTGV
jgi:hypothetical protein